jgi:hypothetical protein
MMATNKGLGVIEACVLRRFLLRCCSAIVLIPFSGSGEG